MAQISSSTFQNAGGAVSDLFSAYGAEQSSQIQAEGLRIKSQGDLAEAQQYDLAQKLALQNKQYTETSTGIQVAQQERQNTMQIGGQEAQVAGAGFAQSGSALDILADSARQGALASETLKQQGLINEAGFEEQANSYGVMSSAARTAAGEEQQIAGQEESLGKTQMWGDVAGGLLKGAAAVASVALAPETGGASLALGGAAASAIGDPSGIGSLF